MLMLCYEGFLVEEHNELRILDPAIRQRREVGRREVERRKIEKMNRHRGGAGGHHDKFRVEVHKNHIY